MAEAASAVESSGSLGCLPRPIALAACAALAILYVALLYVPSLLPGLPRRTPRDYMLHRFVSAAVASVISPILAFTILPVRSSQKSGIHLFLKTFGLRTDYVLQASIYSLLLTATLYLGPLTMEISDILHVWKEETGIVSIGGDTLASTCGRIFAEAKRLTLDVFAWRNYVVAPISEELVFRACMTPILLCGSFSLTLVVFISPTFFSSAHIHHFVELVYLRKYQKYRAALSVGIQLCYTTVFGWYATFLYLRTGHLISAIIAHIFCNFMGLPDLSRALREKVFIGPYIIGLISFFSLLGPISDPRLYGSHLNHCGCRFEECWPNC